MVEGVPTGSSTSNWSESSGLESVVIEIGAEAAESPATLLALTV